MTIPYAAYRKIVLIAVTMTIAVPVPTMNAATVKSHDTTAIAISEFAGVRYLCETFFSQLEPGRPASREKPKSLRPAAATEDRPQKAIAMAMPAEMKFPRKSPRL